MPAYYGESFDTTLAISITELATQMQGKHKIDAVVYGSISESCQSEGCWLNLESSSGTMLFVDWDHKFNAPFDIKGRKAFVSGYAYIDSSKATPEIAFKASGVHL